MSRFVQWLGAALVALLSAGPLPATEALPPVGGVVELEEVVVSATRTPLRPDQVASAVTVIGRREIEQSGARDLAGLLEQAANLDISRAGGPGGTATLRLRGLGDAHTLFLVDGMELNDPASPGRAVDLSTIPLEAVERVEIVAGPQSALYGADAMGGVVQVFTRPLEPGLRLGVQGGNLGQAGLRAGAAGRRGALGLGLDLGHDELGGWSAARPASGGGEADGLRSSHGRLRVDWRPRPTVDLDLALSREHSRADLDNMGGAGGEDPNHVARTRRQGVRLHAAWGQGAARSEASLWEQRTARDYDNPVDALHPGESLSAAYRGSVSHLGLQHARPLGRDHNLLLAMDWERERAHSSSLSSSEFGDYAELFPRRQSHALGLVLQDNWRRGPWTLTASLRRDQHSRQGGESTGRLAAGWSPAPGLLLRGSAGTGFKAPSLYQLHSAYGNRELRAERSSGADLGLDLRHGSWHASLSAFRIQVREQIEFDGATWLYTNLGRTHSRGLEAEAGGPLLPGLDWSARLLRQQVRDDLSGQELPRRPGSVLRLGLEAGRGPGRLAASWRREGRRLDLDFAAWPARQTELPAFACLDLRGSWRWSRQLSTWFTVRNLLDARVEEILGYQGEQRAWRLGLDWNL
jgi:vitamin B12 transporter